MTETITSKNAALKNDIRLAVRGVYDVQKLRIQTGNRVVASFRVKLGLASSENEEDNEVATKVLTKLRASYDKITDGVKVKIKGFKGDGVISSFTEFSLVQLYVQLEDVEKQAFKNLEKIVKQHPIWTEYLEGVKGCGFTMAGVIISELDPHVARYPSSFWKYAGVDVVHKEDPDNPDNIISIGRCRRKDLMVEVEYVDRDGNDATRMSLGYNPFLKTKLLGILAPSFLKSKGEYYDVYFDYKQRLLNDPRHKEKRPAHINRMALRYAVKIFLMNLHIKWRELEGLEVTPPYHEAKLGMAHKGKMLVGGKERSFSVE